MRKTFTLLLCLFILSVSTSCGQSVQKSSDYEKSAESMFVLIESAISWSVVYHKETKVMYTVSKSTYNTGSFTLLVDQDGRPLLYEEVSE